MTINLKTNQYKFLISSAFATYIEYLDYVLYGHVAIIISKNFFPQSDPFLAIILTWSIFFTSFLVRPIGAIIFGHIGDIFSYRVSLISSMILLCLSTSLIGVIPNYSQINIYAPISLLLLRIIQGLSVSPEYTGPSVYLSQFKENKNYFNLKCSITCITALLGMTSGSIIIAKLTDGFTVDNLPEWRWRAPFIISGLLVGIVGLILRLNMQKVKQERKNYYPIKSMWFLQKKETILAILVSGFSGMLAYSVFGFIGTFLSTYRHFSLHDSLLIIGKSSIFVAIGHIISAFLADKYGRKIVMVVSSFNISIFSCITYFFITYRSLREIYFILILYSITQGCFTGIIPAFLAKLFKKNHKFTASCLSHNIGIAWLGGTTPVTLTFFSQYHPLIPGFIVATISLLICISVIILMQPDYKNIQLPSISSILFQKANKSKTTN